MESARGTMRKFVYYGLEENLKFAIAADYNKNTIKLLFNVDGIPIYKNSSIQFWAFLGKVMDKDYESWLFVIAVFCGDSKPLSIREYMQDFINELPSISCRFSNFVRSRISNKKCKFCL